MHIFPYIPAIICKWLTRMIRASIHRQTHSVKLFLLLQKQTLASPFSCPTFLQRCDHTSPRLPHPPSSHSFQLCPPPLSPARSQSPVDWGDTSSQSVYLLKLATSAPLFSSPLPFSLVSFLWAPHHCVSTLPVSFSVPSLCSTISPRETCANHERLSSHNLLKKNTTHF